MINGEILSPSLYRRLHFADDQRRNIESFIMQTVSLRRWSTARYWVLHYIDGAHFADDQRRDIESFIIQTVPLRRWSTARYWVLHYTDGLLRRWSTARYWVLDYTDGFTSPMINGEISMPTLYRRFHFADDQRRDIDAYFIPTVYFADDQRRDIESFIIQTVSLRRWSTARYWVLDYTDGFTSPMINGEILSPLVYRRLRFADDQRRDIESFNI